MQALYRYYGDDMPLQQVIEQTTQLEEGGTLAVFLASHALRRGYRAKIYTYNLQVFDPIWFGMDRTELRRRLALQLSLRTDPKLRLASRAYLEFLDLGGELRFEDLSRALIRRYLSRGVPILTGLSATFLYRTPREFGPRADFDDVRGSPSGHFVILSGYDRIERSVLIADPLRPNPLFREEQIYVVSIDRVIGAILLGILTYDANLLIIEPAKEPRGKAHVQSPRGR